LLPRPRGRGGASSPLQTNVVGGCALEAGAIVARSPLAAIGEPLAHSSSEPQFVPRNVGRVSKDRKLAKASHSMAGLTPLDDALAPSKRAVMPTRFTSRKDRSRRDDDMLPAIELSSPPARQRPADL